MKAYSITEAQINQVIEESDYDSVVAKILRSLPALEGLTQTIKPKRVDYFANGGLVEAPTKPYRMGEQASEYGEAYGLFADPKEPVPVEIPEIPKAEEMYYPVGSLQTGIDLNDPSIKTGMYTLNDSTILKTSTFTQQININPGVTETPDSVEAGDLMEKAMETLRKLWEKDVVDVAKARALASKFTTGTRKGR